MKAFFVVAGILLILMGLVLLIVNPIIGIIGIAIGVFALWNSKRYKKKTATVGISAEKSFENPVQETVSQEKISDESNIKTETIKVAGISKYTDAVLSLGHENEDYSLSKKEIIENGLEDEDIYQYLFRQLPATFVFEPDNEYDSNAIAIYVAGVKIGYVKQGSIPHIRKLINEDRIVSASCEIVGGNSKRLDSENNSIEKTELNYGARITLKTK